MIVQFDQSTCLKHKQPLLYICNDPMCTCDVRLCLKCAQEHQNKTDVDDDFLKENVFSKKLEIETEIIAKQYSHLEKFEVQGKDSSLLNSKNEQSLHYVEMIMKMINEEKRLVFRNLEEFNFSHFDVKKKLNKIKASHPGVYLNNIASKNMIQILVRMSSEEGLDKLSGRVAVAQSASQRYHQFMNAVKKYGNSSKEFLEGLGFKEKDSFRKKIEIALCEWRANQKVEVCLDRHRFNSNQKKEKSPHSPCKRGLRYESPKRKITLVGAGMRPRVNSGKEN